MKLRLLVVLFLIQFYQGIFSQNVNNMDQTFFWKIIEETRDTDINRQIQNIKLELIKLDKEQIIEFERILRREIIEADHFNLIAAQKIIDGAVSDDTFLYFRCWLILLGKDIFKKTIETPDYLASFIKKGVDTWGEGLLIVSTEAFCLKTNKKIENEDERFPRSICFKEGLDYDFSAPPTKGDESVMDHLETMFPILWKKMKN